MKKSLCSVLLLSFLILLFSGCESLMKKSKPPKNDFLEPSIMTRFNDIPIPSGFKVLTKESYSFESSGVRVGVLKYQGKANIEQVMNFYKEQMAMYNWHLLNVIEYHERTMNFDRDNEICTVSLVPQLTTIAITVRLGPKSPVPAPAKRTDKKPFK